MQIADTLIELFYEWENTTPDDIFLRQPFGDTWEEYTWSQAGQMARRVATYLLSLDLPPKSNIGLVSKNCREWIISDLAIMMSGHVSVPLYPTLNAEEMGLVLDIGDVKLLIAGKLDSWQDMKEGVPDELPLIKFPHYSGSSNIDRGTTWEDIINEYEPLQYNYKPDLDDLWTIVFTSGTTGIPKGVMHSYRLLKNAGDVTAEMNVLRCERANNRFFSYLPLNHIAERAAVESQCLHWGGSISFPESLETFGQNLRSTRPTLFFGVPRIFTKLQLGVLSNLPQKKLDRLLSIPVVKGIIKKKIKKGLGLDAARTILVGAAPMSISSKEWWKKLDMPISEGYGMTENIGVSTFLDGRVNRPGSIGKFYPENDVKIDAESGEISIKCPWNMLGYYKNEDQTNETLKDGWLHTGDQGHIDEEGYVYLTGRVKDNFKTAKGKYIAPAPIEWKFTYNEDIEQVCVAGLGLSQPMALIVPSEIGLKKDKKVLEQSLMETFNKANREVGGYKVLSHLIIVKEPWTVENGILTPTLKVKRAKIDQAYLEKMEKWKERKDSIIWES